LLYVRQVLPIREKLSTFVTLSQQEKVLKFEQQLVANHTYLLQKIVFYEWLPVLLGRSVPNYSGIILQLHF